MSTLERRVLNEHNHELREYFSKVVRQMSSLSVDGMEDGVALSTEEDLEQMALLFAHYDVDGDGFLSRAEFRELIRLIASKGGQPYSDDHIETLFLKYDLDTNELIDLNELLLVHVGKGLDA